jgi:hypothetical protein
MVIVATRVVKKSNMVIDLMVILQHKIIPVPDIFSQENGYKICPSNVIGRRIQIIKRNQKRGFIRAITSLVFNFAIIIKTVEIIKYNTATKKLSQRAAAKDKITTATTLVLGSSL